MNGQLEQHFLKLLQKYDSLKQIEEIIMPFVDGLQMEVLNTIISAKTPEELWNAQGQLQCLTKIEKMIKWQLMKLEKEKKEKK